MEHPKMNRKSQRSGPVERSDCQFKNPENPSNARLHPCRSPPVQAEPMNNITVLVLPWSPVNVWCVQTRKVMFFIGYSARTGGLLHGYERKFDGFSGFLNWLPEWSTGALLWAFLFILGRSIEWHTYWRMVLNHPVYIFLNYKKVQTFRFANCTTIVKVKEKVIKVTVILLVQF